MRLHLALDDILTSKARLSVLRALVLFPGKEFTGRELARFAGVSLAQTQDALATLDRAGLAERRTVGRSHQWRVVGQNVLWPKLRDLFRAEGSALPDLQQELARILEGSPVRKATIFGSVARGRERADSDLDLFVEVPDARAEERVSQVLSSAVVDLGRRYGISVNPIVTATSRKRRLNPNVLRDVETSGLSIPLVRTSH